MASAELEAKASRDASVQRHWLCGVPGSGHVEAQPLLPVARQPQRLQVDEGEGVNRSGCRTHSAAHRGHLSVTQRTFILLRQAIELTGGAAETVEGVRVGELVVRLR